MRWRSLLPLLIALALLAGSSRSLTIPCSSGWLGPPIAALDQDGPDDSIGTPEHGASSNSDGVPAGSPFTMIIPAAHSTTLGRVPPALDRSAAHLLFRPPPITRG